MAVLLMMTRHFPGIGDHLFDADIVMAFVNLRQIGHDLRRQELVLRKPDEHSVITSPGRRRETQLYAVYAALRNRLVTDGCRRRRQGKSLIYDSISSMLILTRIREIKPFESVLFFLILKKEDG